MLQSQPWTDHCTIAEARSQNNSKHIDDNEIDSIDFRNEDRIGLFLFVMNPHGGWMDGWDKSE